MLKLDKTLETTEPSSILKNTNHQKVGKELLIPDKSPDEALKNSKIFSKLSL
jgi:hypothetical protein